MVYYRIYIVKFFELYTSAVLLLVLLFCRNKTIPLWSLFLIVYLHLQWNAVLTQIMLCLAESILRNSIFFLREPLLNLY
jgi:hypothetical protein